MKKSLNTQITKRTPRIFCEQCPWTSEPFPETGRVKYVSASIHFTNTTFIEFFNANATSLVIKLVEIFVIFSFYCISWQQLFYFFHSLDFNYFIFVRRHYLDNLYWWLRFPKRASYYISIPLTLLLSPNRWEWVL